MEVCAASKAKSIVRAKREAAERQRLLRLAYKDHALLGHFVLLADLLMSGRLVEVGNSLHTRDAEAGQLTLQRETLSLAARDFAVHDRRRLKSARTRGEPRRLRKDVSRKCQLRRGLPRVRPTPTGLPGAAPRALGRRVSSAAEGGVPWPLQQPPFMTRTFGLSCLFLLSGLVGVVNAVPFFSQSRSFEDCAVKGEPQSLGSLLARNKFLLSLQVCMQEKRALAGPCACERIQNQTRRRKRSLLLLAGRLFAGGSKAARLTRLR